MNTSESAPETEPKPFRVSIKIGPTDSRMPELFDIFSKKSPRSRPKLLRDLLREALRARARRSERRERILRGEISTVHRSLNARDRLRAEGNEQGIDSFAMEHMDEIAASLHR